jgi:hypothetical protein
MFSISSLYLFISNSSGFAKLYTKFDGTTLLKLLPVHFRNAPHKHNFISDALNNRIAAVGSSNLYWVNLTTILRGRQQNCPFVHSVASRITFCHTSYLVCWDRQLCWYQCVAFLHDVHMWALPEYFLVDGCASPVVRTMRSVRSEVNVAVSCTDPCEARPLGPGKRLLFVLLNRAWFCTCGCSTSGKQSFLCLLFLFRLLGTYPCFVLVQLPFLRLFRE